MSAVVYDETLANEIAKFDWRCRRVGCVSRKWWVKYDDPTFIICSRCRWWIDRRRGPRSKTAQRFFRLDIVTPKEIYMQLKPRKPQVAKSEVLQLRLANEVMQRIRLYKSANEKLTVRKVIESAILFCLDSDGNWTPAGGNGH